VIDQSSARQAWLEAPVAQGVASTPEPNGEKTTGIAPLADLGILRIGGRDARKFLHAQLTNDIADLTSGQACLAAWCDAKGRMLALFQAFATDNDITLLAPRDVLDENETSLRRFVLRSKVTFERLDDEWGCGGVSTGGEQGNALLPVPGTVLMCHGTAVVGISANNAIACGPFHALEDYRRAAALPTVEQSCWELKQIGAGIPQIYPATMGQFVPQMVNLEVLGGVSFSKGCYPGQEIVARTQYLGRTKRRMFRAAAEPNTGGLGPGDPVFDQDGARLGMVVRAAPVEPQEMLVVLRLEAQNAESLSAGENSRRPIHLRALPYIVDGAVLG
jgi:tRNA-modifying protein YgfZ